MTSIGDLARHLTLKKGVGTAKAAQARLLEEMSSGVKSDVNASLQGNLAPLASLDNRLARLSGWDNSINRLSIRLDSTQAALGAMAAIGEEMSVSLLGASATASAQPIDLASLAADENFSAVLSILNAQNAGHSLFAGTALDQPAVGSGEDILGHLMPSLSGFDNAQDAIDHIKAWFSSPSGFETLSYKGNGQTLQTTIGDDQSVNITLNANSPEIKGLLVGLVAAAALKKGLFSATPREQENLARLAGEHLAGNAYDQTMIASRIGVEQARLDTVKARYSAERTSLTMARGTMRDADYYEVSSALEQTETRISLLHTLTARLQDLSLARYLR